MNNFDMPSMNVNWFDVEDIASTSGGGIVLPPDEEGFE